MDDVATNEMTPWTLVQLTTDDGPATMNASLLLPWLADRPDITLHTVLWLPGWAGPAPFDAATFHDVAADHEAWLSRTMRRVRLARVAGVLTARAARSTLSSAPRDGVLFLNGAASAVVLGYLPPGERTVLTCIHHSDRKADPPLAPHRVEQLLGATDIWLAADEATADWAADAWGIDRDAVRVLGELLDPAGLTDLDRQADPDRLSLAVAGGSWFRRNHTARLVQTLLRLRPTLRLEIEWTEVDRESDLAPLLADLRTLGVLDRIRIPAAHPEVWERMHHVDVLALTTPDEEPPWLAWEATGRGLPVVCFDTHPNAPEVGRSVEGDVVPYLDVVAMAQAVLARRDRVAEQARGTERAQRDVRRVGAQLVEIAGGGHR